MNKNKGASVSRETKGVERRRKLILNVLMTELHSPERKAANDQILSSYPKLRPLVTDLATAENVNDANIDSKPAIGNRRKGSVSVSPEVAAQAR